MDRMLTKRLHKDYIKAYKLTSAITHGMIGLVLAAYFILAFRLDWTLVPGWIGLLAAAMSFGLFTFVVPGMTYRRFLYELFEEELELQTGLVFRKNVLVPMVRVQHVELESGPLMRSYDLASVSVVTAASTHKIHGLKLSEAQQLKRTIGRLAKVDVEDE